VLIGSGSSRRAQRSSTTDLLPRRRYAKSAAKGEACFRRRAEFKWLELLRQVAPGVSRLTIGQTSAPIKVEDRAGLGSAASCAAKLSGFLGADGMKTGFICASGFNLVASATRDGRRLIAVVLGAPSSQARAVKAAQLLERGFNTSGGLSWLMPSLGTVETMRPINAAPLNLRDEMCSPHRKRGLLREPRLCVVGRWPRCHLWNDRLLQHLAPTRHFLGTQDRPVQCAERAPDYEGGEQPRKFVVIGHDAGLVGSSQARNLHY
jgi:hypothetical protein